MTVVFAVALIAIVLIVVAYCVAVYRFGFHAEYFMAPNDFDNLHGLTDDEMAIVEAERVQELADEAPRVRVVVPRKARAG